MTSEYGAGGNPPGTSGRRTATIDLTATEIPNPAQQESAAPQRPPDTGAAPPSDTSAQPGSTTSSDTPAAAPSGGRGLALFAAGFAGAAMILMLAGTFWLGMLLARRNEAPAPTPVVSAPPSADPALANRVAGAEENARSAAAAIAALRGRVDEIASTARAAQSRAESAATTADAAQKAPSNAAEAAKNDIDALTTRLAALEKSLSALQAELEKRNMQADDRVSRFAIAASALQAAVLRGAPFVAELAMVKSLGVDGKAVAPLESFAAAGLTSPEQLSRELITLLPAMRKPLEEQRPASGLLDKIQANAERLVRVRPVGDVSGDDASAVMARVEARARQADIEGARSEIAKLPAGARAPAEQWLKSADIRVQALAAARQLAQDALAALGKAP